MRKIILLLLAVTTVALSSCKKEDMSKYATKEDVAKVASDSEANSKAKIYQFSLTFGPGTTQQFAPQIYKDSPEDIVLVFTKWDQIGSSTTWAQCPVTYGTMLVLAEFTDYSLIINVIKSDGNTGSPLTQNGSFAFRAVVIPVAGIKANPNVDLTNYEAVKKAFLD
jgi:hypothetical protein